MKLSVGNRVMSMRKHLSWNDSPFASSRKSRSRSRSWSSVSSRSGDDHGTGYRCRKRNGGAAATTISWDTDDERCGMARRKRNTQHGANSGDLLHDLQLNPDASEEKMKLRKRAFVLGNFRFISRKSGAELESESAFVKAVEGNSMKPVPYASKPIGYPSIPRSKSTTRYAMVNGELPGIGDRYHVAWSGPSGDVHVDGMVKLYDMKSVQAHYIECDSRGPKCEWFGLVDPRVTDTPDGKIQFDANMFWTVGLLWKHLGTCGVEDWDDELSGMARTHTRTDQVNAAGRFHEISRGPAVVSSAVSAPSAASFGQHYKEACSVDSNNVANTFEDSCRYTGCVVDWRGTYGFVSCNHISGRVFLHSNDIEGWYFGRELPVGTSVNFNVSPDPPKGNKALRARPYI